MPKNAQTTTQLHSQQKMEKLFTVSKNKTGNILWLRSRTPYCQIQTELKKVGKTTKPFTYDLNQIPYVYTVEVMESQLSYFKS